MSTVKYVKFTYYTIHIVKKRITNNMVFLKVYDK